MRRQSSTRSWTTILKHSAVTPALAALILAGTVEVPAQTKNSPTSQAEKQAREKASDFLKQAEKALKNNKFDAAKSLIEKAKETDSSAPGIADLSKKVDHAEKAAKAEAEKSAKEKAAKLNADKVKAILSQADDLRKAGRYDHALKQVDSALELDANNSKAKKLKDRIKSDQTKAQEKALENRIDGLVDQAEAAIKADKYDIAKAKEAEARTVAGSLFKKDLDELKADIAKAESRYNSEKNESQIKALLSKANSERKADKFEAARDSATQVFQYDPQNAKAKKLIARIASDRSEFQAEQIERQIEAKVDRADALLKAKKYSDAKSAYEVILTEDRGNKDAQKGLKKANSEIAKLAAIKERAQATAQAKRETKKEAPKAPVAKAPATKPEVAKAEVKEVAQVVEKPVVKETAKPVAPAVEKAPVKTTAAASETAEKAAAEAKRKAEVEAREKAAAEKAAEAEAKRKAEVEAREKAAAEKAAEAEAKRKAEVEAREKAAAEKAAEAEAKSKAEAEKAAAAEAERVAKEEERRRVEEARQAEEQRERLEEERQAQAKERRVQAERAYEEGVTLYNQGELARARQRWLDAKELDATYNKPDAYLENTEEEYNSLLANQAQSADFERREAAALEKMNTLIAMSTDNPLVLREFLQTLRLFSGIDFVIAGEVSARVEAAFEDEPLHEVLDAVLTPIGLRWERQPGTDRIVITPDLRTEVFPVLPETLVTVDSLVKEGVIGRLLYGPQGTAVLQGQEVISDPRQNIVIITDSEVNVEKFRRFLENLKGTKSTQLIFKTFQIDPRKTAEVKALLEAILSADDKAPYNPERKLIFENDTLILKDTAENIQKAEQILQDENFLSNFYTKTLDVATFNLTPILSFEENPDLSRAFADQVRQVVETLLYAQEGRSKAEAAGRRLFYDAATMQLTIVDTPDRLETVANYVESLPQIRARRRSKIVFLDWATAGDLSGQIQDFIGGDTDTTSESTADEVTKSLRTEDEFEFRGAVFRVLSVNENDLNDDTDDEVELYIRSGTNDQEETIEVGRQTTFDDFVVVAEDISPSSSPGEGRARLRIIYDPVTGGGGNDAFGPGGGGGQQQEEEEPEDNGAEDAELSGIQIVPVENLNALFLSYTNIEDLREVEFWIQTLDIPTLQVSIEIKFVEVVSSKAKQFKSQLNFGDLTESQTLSDSVLRSRFAQDRDEFGSPFEQMVESTSSANLLKGTTVFDFIVNNGAAPISVELKMLEAQGLINVVNGPTVTVLNNISATFEIERQFGIPQPVEGSTGGDEDLTAVASLTPVDLSVTPNVTRAGNIQLQVDVEMRDFDQNLGQLVTLSSTGDDATAVIPTGTAMASLNQFGVLRKTLETEVRIKDGGTVVLGGWRNERTDQADSGIPILRDIPFIGRLLFNRFQSDEDKITLLIFLTGQVVRD